MNANCRPLSERARFIVVAICAENQQQQLAVPACLIVERSYSDIAFYLGVGAVL